MTQSVAILGRQPALGIAELESLHGADKLSVLGQQQAIMIDMPDSEINFNRLGGTVKLGKLLTILDTTNWPDIAKWLIQTVPTHLEYLPDGKLQLGISTYGLAVSTARLNASGLELKKVIRTTGRSVRLIPNKSPELNSAQVLHNHLAGPLGWEFLFIRDGNRTYVAQTVAIQNIEAYAARDQARPKRDARVGMLPPKLAQIIINLSIGQLEEIGARSKESRDSPPSNNAPHTSDSQTVLDPFCGTGVVLQEALLMGYKAYGSDLEPRMIDYTGDNLMWLTRHLPDEKPTPYAIACGDATSYTWQKDFDVIASETYLGRPFSALPAPDVLETVVQDVNTIHRKFLQNLKHQTKTGFRLCIAVPAWKTKNGFRHLPVLDQLTDLGYTRTSFVHVSNQDLIYHRPEQIVARELVVLQRN